MKTRNQSYPADRKADILTKEEIAIKKLKAINDKKGKGGKFYEISNGYKKYLIFVKKGKSVQKTIEKHLKMMGITLNN